ncbi:MAG: IclR family transcriptional regulator [Albidovulum sp.]
MSSTVAKGLRILELLVNAQVPMGAGEVAKASDLTKSNAYRMLRALEAEGYLIQSEDKRTFLPSLKIWEMGNQVMSRFAFVNEAQGTLRWLADETGEAVHLALYKNKQAVTLAQIESHHAVRAFTETGGRAPAHTVATGKAMLAFQPTSEVESICKNLQRVTEQTITRPQILRDQLAQIRKDHIAYNNEEWQDGVRGLAAPILGPRNFATLAVGICGPASRLTHDLDPVYSTLLLKASASLSAQFGLSGMDQPVSTEAFDGVNDVTTALLAQ